MQTRRGFFLGLAMTALVGLMSQSAQAGPITLSIDLNGVVLFTATSTGADQSVTLSTAAVNAVNAALSAAGSDLSLTSASANSNFTGGSTGFLQTTFQVSVLATGSDVGELSVDTTQSGFLSPLGANGKMTSSAGGNFAGVASGNVMYTSDYQGTSSPTLTFGASGGSTSFSGTTPAVPIGTVPSGYTLSNHWLISPSDTPGGTVGGTGSVILGAGVIPEPASSVTMLLGMPLPLGVVFALIRRRRLASA